MGRNAYPAGESRSNFITFKVNDEEGAQLQLLMEKYSMTRSEILRLIMRITFSQIKDCFSKEALESRKRLFVERRRLREHLENEQNVRETSLERDLNKALFDEAQRIVREREIKAAKKAKTKSGTRTPKK